MFTPDSAHGRERAASFRRRLARGETVWLLGISPALHNSGVALVETHRDRGVIMHCNNEEERYSGIKHCTRFPEQGLAALLEQMRSLGLTPQDIHACLGSWNYSRYLSKLTGYLSGELPTSLLMNPFALEASGLPPELSFASWKDLPHGPSRLGEQVGSGEPFPLITMGHHDSHASFAYASSPFARGSEDVMVVVVDGYSDTQASSLYVASRGRLRLIGDGRDDGDSLGFLYGVLSSTQGGWHMLSSEGRYMGAAAWGNGDRLTNPYYRRLRQLVYFGPEGRIHINRRLGNWIGAWLVRPYTKALVDILGAPVAPDRMWHPDHVLDVADIEHAELTRERVDKAAATQMLFEDAVFHVVEHAIRTTGSHQLVMSGGAALNCVATMRLLERFDESYYGRYLGRADRRLHVWVPPVPNDAGVPVGAAYCFALQNGAPPGPPLEHAFHCGTAPRRAEIEKTLSSGGDLGHRHIGAVGDPDERDRIADFMAYVVAKGGIVGLYQGPAETGPRALGHRSILANPCDPRTRENLNRLVKHRELVRPLAPMATPEAARRWFQLSPGAADGDYNAYRYMVLTALARPEAHAAIPAVIHHDGTGRIQIVRRETDPLTFAYLEAMGRYVGVEVSVNTSLNVASPIAQTPEQAVQVLRRSKGMDGIFMVAEESDVYLVWHAVHAPPKDAGRRLLGWLEEWSRSA